MSTLSLILLTLSIHTADNSQFNNVNTGVGIEYTDNITYGVYGYNNSYNKQSIMISASKQYDHFGIGVAAANGYEMDEMSVNGVIVAPEITLKYKNFRIKTSYPFASIAGGADVFNLQYEIKL